MMKSNFFIGFLLIMLLIASGCEPGTTKKPPPTNADAVAADKAALDYDDFVFGGSDTSSDVTEDFTVPTTGDNGSTIIWTASPSGIVTFSDGTGTVTQPVNDTVITITATITKGTPPVTETKTFTITVKGTDGPLSDEDAVATDKAALDYDDLVFTSPDTSSDVTEDFTVPTTGDNGSTIIWTASPSGIVTFSDGTGTVTQPVNDTEITITATITKGTPPVTETKTFTITVKGTKTDDVAADKAALDYDDFVFGGSDTSSDVTEDFTVPTTGTNGSTIEWSASPTGIVTFTDGNAAVTQPVEDTEITLTATITKGTDPVVTETKTFTITVKGTGPSNTIEATINFGDQTITFTPEDKTVTKGGALTVSITAIDGATYQWYIDGDIQIGKTTNSITIDTNITPKQYELMLIVEKDGVNSSGRCYFIITN